MNSKFVMAALIAGAAATSVDAAFVGMEVDAPIVTNSGGFTYRAYRVYAKFNNANDTVLNAYGMSATPAGLFWHNDFLNGNTPNNFAGTWSPTLLIGANANLDSWATIGGNPADFGNSTAFDPGWGAAGANQAAIPANAGWFNQNPPNLQGRVNPATLRTLIAQFVYRDTPVAFTTNITIGYNQGIGTPSQFGTGSFTVPAPGAVALLGLAGLAGRRRRA